MWKRIGKAILFWIVLLTLAFTGLQVFQSGLGHFQDYSFARFVKEIQNLSLNNPVGVIVTALLTGFISDRLNSWLFPDRTQKKVLEGTLEARRIGQETKDSVDALRSFMESDVLRELDPAKLRDYLDMLAPLSSKADSEAKLKSLVDDGQIPANYAAILLEIATLRLEYFEDLNSEIATLLEQGNFAGAELLKEAREYFEEGDSQRISECWDEYKNNQLQEDVRVLEGLIEMAVLGFDLDLAIKLMKELTVIFPGPYSYFKLASYLDSHRKITDAVEYYERAVELCRVANLPEKHIKNSDLSIVLNDLGALLTQLNEFERSEKLLLEALELRTDLVSQFGDAYLVYLTDTLNNLGILFRVQKRLEESKEYYRLALRWRRKLQAQDANRYTIYLASALNNFGNLLNDLDEDDQALEYFEEAEMYYRSLVESDPDLYSSELAATLNNLGILCRKMSDYSRAESCYRECLGIYRKLAEENPDTYTPDLAMILNNLGNLLAELDSEDKALECLEEACTIRTDLVAINPKAYGRDLASTLYNLGILHRNLKDYEAAIKFFNQALKCYQELSEDNPLVYLNHVISTYHHFGNLYLELEQQEVARGYFEKALKLRQELARAQPDTFAPALAKAMLMYIGVMPLARKDVEEAIELLLKIPETARPLDLIQELQNLLDSE